MSGSLKSLLLINGPNLNLLGQREKAHYGEHTLADIEARSRELATKLGTQLTCFQSNAEHTLVERIHSAATDGTDAIIINPGAYTHTSIALRDALCGVALPFIEIHISNVHAREAFRQTNYFSDVANGTISGLGPFGYELAIRAAISCIN